MKTSTSSLLACCLLGFCLSVVGCSSEDTTTTVDTPPPSSDGVSDHSHEHDHKHGPNGYPVVDMDDGTEIEWDFDETSGTFLLIPPAAMSESVDEIAVKTVVDGTENTYAFAAGEQAGSWTLESKELGTAMMMGDAVERTLTITLQDGKALTAAVAHFEGH